MAREGSKRQSRFRNRRRAILLERHGQTLANQAAVNAVLLPDLMARGRHVALHHGVKVRH